MKVSDYLRVPYLVTAESVPKNDGSWVRQVQHPELPECFVEADSISEALGLLDSRRIEVVVKMLRDGRQPPVRRDLLGETQALQRVTRAGLADEIGPLWDLDAESLSARTG